MKKFIFYGLDVLLLCSGMVSLVSSYVLWFIIPRGVGLHGAGGAHCGGGGVGIAGNNQAFWGLFRNAWIELHNWGSVVLSVIVLVHIIFHWSWIVQTTRRLAIHLRRSVGKALEIYGSILILIVLFVFDVLSGLVLWLVLPRGAWDYIPMMNGSGRRFLGLQRIVWLDLHAWTAVTIVAIIIVHLILNWNWVVGVSKSIYKDIVRVFNGSPQAR